MKVPTNRRGIDPPDLRCRRSLRVAAVRLGVPLSASSLKASQPIDADNATTPATTRSSKAPKRAFFIRSSALIRAAPRFQVLLHQRGAPAMRATISVGPPRAKQRVARVAEVSCQRLDPAAQIPDEIAPSVLPDKRSRRLRPLSGSVAG